MSEDSDYMQVLRLSFEIAFSLYYHTSIIVPLQLLALKKIFRPKHGYGSGAGSLSSAQDFLTIMIADRSAWSLIR